MADLHLGTARTPTFHIDGSAFRTLEDFYDEFSRKIIPDVDWGRNLDALEDVLRGGFGTPPHGFAIVWHGSLLSRERLGYEETVRQLRLRLETCHVANRPHVQGRLNDALNATGPTVFDWLCDIIGSADGIDLILE